MEPLKFQQAFSRNWRCLWFCNDLSRSHTIWFQRGYYVPKPESAIQTTSTACDGEIDENDEVDDEEEINPPARKRTNLEESNDELPAKATKSSHHLHSNPLDDSILNKKIGKCISLACSLSACLHSILVVAYCSKDTINS